MRSLAINSLRARGSAMLGLLIAVVTATALLMAFGTMVEFGIRGGMPPERLANAEIVVVARQSVSEVYEAGDEVETIAVGVTERVRLDFATVETVRRVSGVESATSDISFGAHLIGLDGQPLTGANGGPSWGHAWNDSQSFKLLAGRPPSTADEVVLDNSLATDADVSVGEIVDVVAAGHRMSLTVVGVAASEAGSLLQQAALFFDDTTASRLYDHPGEVDAIAVSTVKGADPTKVGSAIEAAIGGDVEVLTGIRRGRAEFVDARAANATLVALGGTVGGISVFAAAFVVAGMFALVIQQRSRELALMRLIGATKRQVRRMIRFEILAVSLIGALVGIWPGAALAELVSTLLKGVGALPQAFQSETGNVPAVIAVLLVACIGSTAGFVAGRRATAVRPVEALRQAHLPPRRLGVRRIVLGLLSLLAVGGLWMLSTSGAGNVQALAVPLHLSLLVAATLFAPWLARGGLGLIGRASRLSRVGGYLAVANMKTLSSRLALAVMPAALVITVGASGLLQQTTIASAVSEQHRERIVADTVVDAGPMGLSPEVVAELTARPDIDTAIGLYQSTVYAGRYLVPYPAVGVTSGSLDRVLNLDLVSGSKTELGPSETAISVQLAEDLGVGLGEDLSFRLGDGVRAEHLVVAIYARSAGFNDIVLPGQVVSDHVTSPVVSTILIRSEGAGPEDRFWSTFEQTHPGSSAGDPTLMHSALAAAGKARAGVSFTIYGMLFVFAAIAMVNILIVMTSGRKRDFAQMRMLGASRGQVGQMVGWEALIVTLIACLIGGAISAVHLAPLSEALLGSWTPAMSWMQVGALAAIVLILALVATLLPTRRSLRQTPIEVIRA